MPQEDPALRSYRRFLVAFTLVAGLIATTVGAVLLWNGHVFPAFLCVCVVAWLVLIAHGYRQDQAERERRERGEGTGDPEEEGGAGASRPGGRTSDGG